MIRDVRSFRVCRPLPELWLAFFTEWSREEFVGEEGRDLMYILKGFHWPF